MKRDTGESLCNKYAGSFCEALKNVVNKQISEDETRMALSLMPSIMSVAVHPQYNELIAVATQQTIQLFDLKQSQDSPIWHYDIETSLIVQSLTFTVPAAYSCHFKESSCVLAQERSVQLIILYKGQNFLHIIDFLNGHNMEKLEFQEPVIQVLTQNITRQVTFQCLGKPSDGLYEALQDSGPEVPRQYFFALSKEELFVITVTYDKVHNKYHYYKAITQLPLLGRGPSVYPSMTADRANNLYVLQGTFIFQYQYGISKKGETGSYFEEMRVLCKQYREQNQGMQHFERFLNDTFRLPFHGKNIDQLRLLRKQDLSAILKDGKTAFRIQYNNGYFYVQSDIGIIVSREIQEPPQCGKVAAVLTFGFGEVLRLFYKPPEANAEQSSAYDPSGSFSNLSDYGRYAGAAEEQSILSDSEETSSMDQIARLDEADHLIGFDHFVHGASVLLGEGRIQDLPVRKLLRSNLQLTPFFHKLYGRVRGMEQTEVGAIQLQAMPVDFGQQIAFSSDGRFVCCYCNPLVPPSVFAVEQFHNTGQSRAVVVQAQAQIPLFGPSEPRSRNVLQIHDMDGFEILIWSRANQFVLMQSVNE